MDEVGVFSIVLELMTAEVAKIITEKVSVPTIDIGAGPYCDGQVLVFHDMLDLFERFTSRFVKKYANLSEIILNAVQEYVKEVKAGEAHPKSTVFT